MELELIRGIWGYHWWGNRKHFDEVAAGVGGIAGDIHPPASSPSEPPEPSRQPIGCPTGRTGRHVPGETNRNP